MPARVEPVDGKGDGLIAVHTEAGQHIVVDTARYCTLSHTRPSSIKRRCGRCLRQLTKETSCSRSCRFGCHLRFCSKDCEAAAIGAGHKQLCVGEEVDHESALARLFATKMWRHSVTFRLCVIALAEAYHLNCLDTTCPVLRLFCHGEGFRTLTEAEVALKGILPAIELLSEAWSLSEAEQASLEALLPRVIGAVVLNAQRVLLLDDPCEREESGVGLFAIQSKANHACQGSAQCNARVEPRGGMSVALVASRTITSGEEVAFDYMPSSGGIDADRPSKLKALYNFDCDCERCRTERVPAAAGKHQHLHAH